MRPAEPSPNKERERGPATPSQPPFQDCYLGARPLPGIRLRIARQGLHLPTAPLLFSLGLMLNLAATRAGRVPYYPPPESACCPARSRVVT